MTARRVKAIELHCHLDGSVRLATIEELARQQGLEYPVPVAGLATVSDGCGSLVEYINAIDVALDVLQTPEALCRAAAELVEDWRADDVLHGEARFAPELHTRRGLDFTEIIDSVAEGLREGERRTAVRTSLILCCMRPSDPPVTWKVVEAAARHPEVSGVDVAGPEYQVPLLPHAPAFRAAKDAGLRVAVHAGEADGAENVWQALDEFGAERIGHGVKSIRDDALVKRLAADRILLEICPTSNLHTKAIDRIEHHPIEQFRRQGVPISLSTDARTVSGVTMQSEYQCLVSAFGWTPQIWNETQRSALRVAFVSTQARGELAAALTQSP
jgi:adenosine deaminase